MNRIRDLRTAARMSQAKLGDRLGCVGQTVSKFENETRQLDPPTICALCDIFGCTADYLIGRSGTPYPTMPDEAGRIWDAYKAATKRDRDLVDHILGLDVPERKKDAAAS